MDWNKAIEFAQLVNAAYAIPPDNLANSAGKALIAGNTAYTVVTTIYANDLARAGNTEDGFTAMYNSPLACPPKPGPVLMGIVQLAESQGAIHAKTTQTGPDRGYPPRLPSRPRRRLEHQPCLPQGRDRTHHLLPLEGPPGGPHIE